MNYQKLIIVGNATKDAQPRQSKDGEKTFSTFDVGVSDGKDKTTYFPVVVFGKQDEAVAKYVTKCRHVLVGRPRAGQRQGLLQRRGRLGTIWPGGNACQRRTTHTITKTIAARSPRRAPGRRAHPPRRRFFGYDDNR